ncbi:hypothetical protein AO242_17990 [Pseudomonas sp. ICMP 561]|nr:hypothetical protein AO242_17990 [Pseudomonas sp. ICMP 561]
MFLRIVVFSATGIGPTQPDCVAHSRGLLRKLKAKVLPSGFIKLMSSRRTAVTFMKILETLRKRGRSIITSRR